ncbi:MAG: hypothetical protein FWG85_01595 [Bacteroidetes bacterium]|nr:hypothetical protein [Bacteroidota bacterium]
MAELVKKTAENKTEKTKKELMKITMFLQFNKYLMCKYRTAHAIIKHIFNSNQYLD